MGYPSIADEKIILTNLQRDHPVNSLGQVVDGLQLSSLQRQVWEIHVDTTLQDYIVGLVSATRAHPDLALGGSPRASLALFKTAQALAAVRDRDHVIPDDIKYLVPYTLTHRLIAKPEAELRGRTVPVILNEILQKTSLEIGSIV
jgi:MoxR-like ATPase